MNLVLANSDYRSHITSEGDQLQSGFENAGWNLAGFGYADDCTDVEQLIERYQPKSVFVQDMRDWRSDSRGCFDKRVDFQNWELLANHPEIFRSTVCKDAGTDQQYQREFSEKIHADAIIIYYHQKSVLKLSPWLENYPLVRTYHTIDRAICERIVMPTIRRRGIVTGAVGTVYPLRRRVFRNAFSLGIDTHDHPGYGNGGCRTTEYLRLISAYKTHVATASKYGFALRKIIESVATGCTPITDLPEYDVLPEIDGALCRISSDATDNEISNAINKAVASWNLDERMNWAKKAWDYYDYRTMGRRLSDNLLKIRTC